MDVLVAPAEWKHSKALKCPEKLLSLINFLAVLRYGFR